MKLLRHISFGLLITMVAVLAAATVLEKSMGAETVKLWVYESPVFMAFWGLIAVLGAIYIVGQRLYRRMSVFMLHLSLILILVGAGTSWLTSERGKIKLTVGDRSESFTDAGGRTFAMPFTIALTDFHINFWPGTKAPQDFVSELEIVHGARTVTGTASMNKVFAYHGYRFYQMGYDPNGNGAVIQVSHDPWGIGITYSAYMLLLLSMIWVLMDKRNRFAVLLRQKTNTKVIAALAALLVFPLTSSAGEPMPRTLPADIANEMGNLYILHNDRICPFSTFARDISLKIQGKSGYRRLSDEQIMTGWIFFYDDWKDARIIRIKSDKVRTALNLDGKYASLSDFYSPQNEYRLQELVAKVLAGDNVADRQGIREANEKYEIARMLATGSIVKILPVKINGELQWLSQSSTLDIPAEIDTDKWAFLHNSLNYLNELVVKKDWDAAREFIAALRRYQVKECGNALPSPTQFRAEKLYNNVQHSGPLAMFLAALGIIIFLVQCHNMAKGHDLARWIRMAVLVVSCLTFAYLTMTIALRWMISSHVPLSNGFETMQFMAWGSVLLTIFLHRRYPTLLSLGTLVTGLSLMVSTFGESNPQITHLMPVLQSPLLSIHVVMIMIAYSLLAFLMLNGLMALVVKLPDGQAQQMHRMGQILLYPAVFLLTTGIFIGAVWANVSWGSYWSWDPKEVWALITLIVYALPLHEKSLPALARPRFFHAYVAVAFLSVIITYFGVNFFLGGMHSYA